MTEEEALFERKVEAAAEAIMLKYYFVPVSYDDLQICKKVDPQRWSASSDLARAALLAAEGVE